MKARFVRLALLLTCLAVGAVASRAQGRGQGGQAGGGMGGQHGGGSSMTQGSGFSGSNHGRGFPPGAVSGSAGTSSSMRRGLQLGPPGRWWDNKGFMKSLGLRKEQQQRMDLAFNANKTAILESYRNLQTQEVRLEATTKEVRLDEGRIFAAIDSVNQARSALEKSNAHMLLMIRQEMDAEQIARMEKFREKPAEE